jgi:hypothetical protein
MYIYLEVHASPEHSYNGPIPHISGLSTHIHKTLSLCTLLWYTYTTSTFVFLCQQSYSQYSQYTKRQSTAYLDTKEYHTECTDPGLT